jgi:serine/threonine protein kinase
VSLRPLPLGDLPRERLELLRLDVRAAVALEHPAVDRTHGLVEVDGRAALISEPAVGEDLATLLQRRRLGVNEATAMARAVGSALEHAHARALPHGALGADTILVGPGAAFRLADFGLARLRRRGALDPREDLRALGRVLLASLPASHRACDASLAALAAADRLRRLSERCARGEVASAAAFLRELNGRPSQRPAPIQRAPLLAGAALVLLLALALHGVARLLRSAPPKGTAAPAATEAPGR